MSSSIWKSASALLAAAIVACVPRAAAAQACCGGPTAFAPARLAPHEDALVGLQIKASSAYGSFDGNRRFVAAPAGTAEVDLEQDVVAAVRVLQRAQLSALVPMVETWRRVRGASEAGGDLGDLQLGARWDFTLPGERRILPGIALLFGVTAPTGRTPEDARKPLATDATGTGAWQLSPALAVEQAHGPWLWNVTGSLAWRSPRTAGDLRAQQGLAFGATATGAYVFRNQAVIALAVVYTAALEARVDGETVPGSGRAGTRLSLSGGLPFWGSYRASATLFGDVPIRWLGSNQPAGAGVAVVLARGFS
ncbi:MAG: transporter [Minicystis sp.]